MNKQAILFWTFIVLAGVGVLTWLGSVNPSRIIIPVVVIGVVFLLYKYPPRRWARKSKSPKIKPSARTMAKVNAQSNARKSSNSSKKRKDYPFQVIQGQKGKSEDDIPKYH